MADGSVTIEINGDSKGLEKEINGIGSKVKSGFGKIGSIAGAALTGVTAAVGGAATALAGLGTASVNSYADLEQNIGGIETLFKGSADKVIKNAENAYKTAGMSANQYMETVTGFSASLLQSLGGDTEKAADVADMALTDMADNANKMGTSMESIQWAYQGFAKQNYTMLDNLKLGYGGTKEEMQRLLADAQKLTGVKYDISNLSDVYNAIHAIQQNLGITGTTAKEAASTITGSVSSMKAAFNNFLNGTGTINQLVDTGITAIQNIVNAAGKLVPDLIQSVAKATPQIVDSIVSSAPAILSSIGQVLMSLIQSLLSYMPQILNVAIQLIQSFINGIITMLPQIIQMGIQLVVQLITGIAQMLPQLIPQAVNAIITMSEGLLDNIDQIVDAGIQLIMGLADGLINAIPILIDKIPTIIEKLIDAFIRNYPKMAQAGQNLISKLASGVLQAVPKCYQAAGKVFSAIWEGIKQLPGMLLGVGKNIVQGLWDGISGATGWLWDKISGFCGGIVNKVKGFFGIHSPSKLFNQEIGKFLALGLGEGFDDNLDKVYKQMKTAVDFETQKLSANLSTTATNNKMLTANITLNQGDIYMDSTKVGRAVTPVVTKTLRGAGAY